MGALDLSALPKNALLVIDSAPVIYVLENREFAARFRPLLELQRTGAIRLAITTTAIVEVLTGPYATGDEALARRYRAMFDSWQVVPLDVPIAESAARLRAELRLKLADAIQLASAFAINADALVTHDRDFSRVKGLRIIC
jgi:predicted nucleic acid-binding protein